METIQLFEGRPDYDWQQLLAAAFALGTLSGTDTEMVLVFGDITVTFMGHDLSLSGPRTFDGGWISLIALSQGGTPIALADSYTDDISFVRAQNVLDVFAGTPTEDEALDAIGDLFYSEPTILTGSDADDTLIASSVFHTTVNAGDGNDILVGRDAADADLNGEDGDDVIIAGNGNNVERGGAGNDTITGGGGNDWMVGGAGSDHFDGGSGWNNIVYVEEQNGGGQGVNFNWVTGVATDSFGDTDTFTNIDSVHGTNAADTFIGNANENTFHGYGGNDVIDGGDGRDAVHYHGEQFYGGANGVTIVLDDGTGAGEVHGYAIDGYGDTDDLTSIENAEGTEFADSITGSGEENNLRGLGGSDTINGAGASDFINPGTGNDIVDGGAGDYDNLEYHDADDGILVSKTDRLSGTVTGTWAGTDTFANIEIVVGSNHDDTFNGSAADDDFTGNARADAFNGGGGSDTVVYSKEQYAPGGENSHGVIVNLSSNDLSLDLGQGPQTVFAGTAIDAFGDTDTLGSIENIVGTDSQDLLVGDDGDNRLMGASGRDFIFGNGGNDHLFGGDDGDFLAGGAGDDIIDGEGSGNRNDDTADYYAEQNGGGLAVSVNFATGAATDTFGDTDTLVNTEEATGTQGNDVLVSGGSGYHGFRRFAGDDSYDRNGATAWIYYGQDVDHGGTEGVVVNLSSQNLTGIGAEAGFAPFDIDAGTAKDGFGDIDTLIDIHDIRGTAVADWIMGSDGGDTFQMQAGDDYIHGGDGNDRIDYFHDVDEGAPDRGVIVNLSDNALTGIDVGLGATDVAAHQAVDGFGDTDTVVDVEEVSGTGFNDWIVGGDGSNQLQGHDGDDHLAGGTAMDFASDFFVGGRGNDTMIGGEHTNEFNRVQYIGETEWEGNDPGQHGVILNLSGEALTAVSVSGIAETDVAAGHAIDSYGDTDTLTSIQNADGTQYDDILVGGDEDSDFDGRGGNDLIIGGNGNNHMVGGDGDDTIIGGTQDDFIRGGQGNDTVDGGGNGNGEYDNIEFHDAETGVIVDKTSRTSGTVTGSWSGTDTFTNIEIVVGSNHDDTFNGSSEDDDFTGNAGADSFNGGDGWNKVVYEKEQYAPGGESSHGVIVNLSNDVLTGVSAEGIAATNVASGTAIDAFGDTDTLSSIEIVQGTEHGDYIVGGDEDNEFDGRSGDDTLIGGSGHNRLWGGDGNDTPTGGDGNDDLDAGRGDDTVIAGGGTVAAYEAFAGSRDAAMLQGFPKEYEFHSGRRACQLCQAWPPNRKRGASNPV